MAPDYSVELSVMIQWSVCVVVCVLCVFAFVAWMTKDR